MISNLGLLVPWRKMRACTQELGKSSFAWLPCFEGDLLDPAPVVASVNRVGSVWSFSPRYRCANSLGPLLTAKHRVCVDGGVSAKWRQFRIAQRIQCQISQTLHPLMELFSATAFGDSHDRVDGDECEGISAVLVTILLQRSTVNSSFRN